MANLQIKGMDDVVYAELKALASSENRSVSQQVLYLIKHWLSHQGTKGRNKGDAILKPAHLIKTGFFHEFALLSHEINSIE